MRAEIRTSSGQSSCPGAALVVAALCLSIGFASPAAACRCAQRSLDDYFAQADFVFLGQAVSVHVEAEPPPRRVVKFDVREKFKGDPASLLYLTTLLSTASCGVPVESGEVYLVFAGRRAEDARLASFDTCDGTRRFDPRNPDAEPGFRDLPAGQVLDGLRALGAGVVEAAVGPTPAPSPRLPIPGDTNARLIGLLDLPMARPVASGATPRVKPVPIRSEPSSGSALLLDLVDLDALATRELTEGRKAVVVREHREGWFRVELTDGRAGWISQSDAGPFFPLARLLVGSRAFLGREWDGWIWPSSGAGQPSPAAHRLGDEQPVNIVGSEEVGGSLWLQVELLDKRPCAGATVSVVHGGWVPAYGPDGELIAWFDPRGC